jgi:hypothetical protein
MFILCFYVPKVNLEDVKTALFNKGAGKFNNYDCCCWETEGVGQYRPLENSNPHLGEKHKLERLSEYKVEIVCNKNILAEVITELLAVHPYEEVAYHVIESYDLSEIKKE